MNGSGVVLLKMWARWNHNRDAIIRTAYRDGVPKTEIHQITGLARSTIDRIIRRRDADL
jgi:hypothetical protein